jgi:hypothetical protein
MHPGGLPLAVGVATAGLPGRRSVLVLALAAARKGRSV